MLTVCAGVIVLMSAVLLVPVTAHAASRSCLSDSDLSPGSLAPAGTPVPAWLLARYAVLRTPQTAGDRLSPGELGGSLSASGVLLAGVRLLGRVAFGGRVYLVPAQHLLSTAPASCPAERQPALCLVVVTGGSGSSSCTSADGPVPDALLYISGTSGYGLVPDGISAVTVTYQTSAPRTVTVRRNFFSVVTPNVAATPCGAEWLDRAGTVLKIPAGCSYLTAEIGALNVYEGYVSGELSTLQSQVAALASALSSGELAQAQTAWLTAHLTWLDIGQDDGAYGCFGALGGEIDGLAGGHPLGTADPAFTGFHRIEYDLWTTHNLAAATTDTAQLQELLAQLLSAPLASYLPATASGVDAWLLRPHEIVEDALRDSLTAADDYGSGTDLASLSADTSAVRELLGLLEPILAPLAPHLVPDATSELNALNSSLVSTQVNGAWVSVQNLPTRERQQIDGDLGAVAETLAPVPDLLTSTGTSNGRPLPPGGDD